MTDADPRKTPLAHKLAGRERLHFFDSNVWMRRNGANVVVFIALFGLATLNTTKCTSHKVHEGLHPHLWDSLNQSKVRTILDFKLI
jgi:hypothetical protein